MKKYDIAIIGGGPGGIACAIEAAVHGIENIILIDKADNHSSTIRKFYKENKRVDKDWKGQTVEIEGNIPFIDGTKETTLDFFDKLLDEEKIDTLFIFVIDIELFHSSQNLSPETQVSVKRNSLDL